MQSSALPVLFVVFMVANIRLAECGQCLPTFVPGKDKNGVDCCKLPREIFPHQAIYEAFCNEFYFGTMADGPDGPFCRMGTVQEKQIIACDDGWIDHFEGLNQFCYKAFTQSTEADIVDIDSSKGDPCQEKNAKARLVRIPNQSVNMFLYVRVLNGTQQLSCNLENERTFYYYTGLRRIDLDWSWRPYEPKAFSHLEEEAMNLVQYLNELRPKHYWADGTEIFTEGWDNPHEISTHVVLSDCAMWRDVKSSLTNFTFNGKHVPNQGFICAYHV